MTQARLIVTMPDGVWIGDVSRTHPNATFRVLAAVPGDDNGFAIVWISGDVASILPDIEVHPVITEMDVVQRTEHEATVQFQTTSPLIMLSSKASGMPIELPVEIVDGKATVDVTGSHERLSELGAQFRNFGLDFRVEYIQERLHASQLLTERQQELLLEAVEHGYYDTPRTCSLTELAAEVGIAKSTCSETLHRAEETIIKHFVEDLPAPAGLEERLVSPGRVGHSP
ncbi:helix-turn-helix domain-containing protein (plasmid) [Haloferacaceae archaeon DSL9]